VLQSGWAFWQYTASGSISGLTDPVDRNRFDGKAPCTIG
jgi:GH25 family lysozyme M1 (1,4-beta-N-acetylmuramidase)